RARIAGRDLLLEDDGGGHPEACAARVFGDGHEAEPELVRLPADVLGDPARPLRLPEARKKKGSGEIRHRPLHELLILGGLERNHREVFYVRKNSRATVGPSGLGVYFAVSMTSPRLNW